MQTFNEIKSELERLAAAEVTASLNEEFEPEAGVLVKIELKGAYWHLCPQRFLSLIKDLPDGAGSNAIHEVIEKKATLVWHGHAPKGSRDTSP
jgi:hypothetical protein